MIKIGVSFPVEGQARDWCLAVNGRVQTLAPGPIRFDGADRNSDPHATIALGTATPSRLEEIRELVRIACQEVGPFAAALGSPERERVTGRYLMSSVQLPLPVSTWRSRLQQKVMPLLEEPGRMTDHAHVTLAVLEDPEFAARVDELLPSIQMAPAWLVSHVDVALSGKKGIKGSVLEAVPLGVASG